MRIYLKTKIRKDFHKVAAGYNQDLFNYLLPPLGLVSLVRYDGQQPGNIIHLRFRGLFKDWKVVIKDVWTSPREYRFVDRGLSMPFGMTYWQHVHRVVAIGPNQSALIDQMEYKTNWLLLDLLLYPLLFLSFFPRKWKYKSYYERKTPRP